MSFKTTNNPLKIWEYILDFLFPKTPEISGLERMSPAEFLKNAPRSDFSHENITSLFEYRHPLVQRALWELKYWKNIKVIELLAKIMHEELLGEIAEASFIKNFKQPILVPIPASKIRLRERGYNQCELLCSKIETIDENKNISVKSVLSRKKEVPSQTTIKQKTLRLNNMKNVFFVHDPSAVKGKNIIIIDDVLTTGSTIRDATRALRETGAKKVLAMTLAH